MCIKVAYALARLTASCVVGDFSVNKDLVSGVCPLAPLAMSSSALSQCKYGANDLKSTLLQQC